MKTCCKTLCLLLCFLFLGCEIQPFFYQEVVVVIPKGHPWQEATHTALWHTLLYSDGEGSLKKQHLPSSVRSVKVKIRCDCLTVFCVYPLSSLFPYGGFYQPGQKKVVALSQEKGSLAKLLLDSYTYNPSVVENLDAVYLSSLVGDAALVDGQKVMIDLLNGSFTTDSITLYEPYLLSLDDLPQGYWIGERISQEPFWSFWGRATNLVISGGLQRYLNQECSLCLTIYGDLKNQRCVVSLGKAPVW
ncbi:MAG: hypothetical protein EOM15_01170 [Spirochaetia bacterium]|nr:hypothetical protein [Spirochaetia bacterium]